MTARTLAIAGLVLFGFGACAERTTEALWVAIGRLLGRFPPAECARYIAHCGYGQSG